MEVRVEIKDTYTAQILAELNLIGDYSPGHAVLYVTPKEADQLDSRGIDYTITIQNLNEHYSDFWDMKIDYHSYQEIVDLADSLVQAGHRLAARTIVPDDIRIPRVGNLPLASFRLYLAVSTLALS